MLWMETGSVSFVLVERETAVEIQTVRDGEMEMEMEIQMVQDGEMVSFEVSRGRGPGGTVYIPPVWTFWRQRREMLLDALFNCEKDESI